MNVEDALDRLKQFRGLWESGDVICEDSKLSTDDLDLLIEWIDEASAGPP